MKHIFRKKEKKLSDAHTHARLCVHLEHQPKINLRFPTKIQRKPECLVGKNSSHREIFSCIEKRKIGRGYLTSGLSVEIKLF